MENLKSYLDGELDIAQQAEVETHLRNDAELQKTVEEFSAISSTLKTADSGEPYGFEKLEEKLKAAPKASIYEKKKIWRLATYWSASMACLALASLLFFPVFAQSKFAAKKSGFGQGSSSDATVMAGVSMKSSKMSDVSASSGGVPNVQAGKMEQDKPTSKDEFDQPSSGTALINGASPSQSGGFGKSAGGESSESNKGDSTATPTGDEANTRGGVAEEPPSDSTAMAKKGTTLNRATQSTGWSDQEDKSSPRTARRFTRAPLPQNGLKGTNGNESGFKSDMRSIRDKTAQPVTTLGDTPHGIYLERAGQVQVKVDDLMRAVNEATGMVQSFHGFVTASDLQNQADGGVATMTIRVPTDSFNATLDKLQAMGEVLSVNSNSQDITSETVEQGARMVSWADEEKRLIDELNKAKTNSQRLQIRNELRNVRANLEAHRASVKSLTERAKFSTINVSFVRGDKAVKAGGTGNWSGDALKGAKDNLGSIGQVVGTMGIYFLVFSPIWLPFAIAAYYIKKKNS